MKIRIRLKGFVIMSNLSTLICRFRSVVVITCASHAQGPRFDPGRKHDCFCPYTMIAQICVIK